MLFPQIDTSVMESALIGKKENRSEHFSLQSQKYFLSQKEILETMLRCFLMKCLSPMLLIA